MRTGTRHPHFVTPWKPALLAGALLLGALIALPGADATATGAFGRPCQIDVVLVIDRSGSMDYDSPTRISMARVGAWNFVAALRPTYDRSALVSFSHAATMDQTLTFTHAATQGRINALVAGGSTNFGDAIDIAHRELVNNGRPDARRVIVSLTDGESNTGPNPVAEAAQAKADGLEIFVIAVGSTVSTATTQSVASTPSATYWRRAVASMDIDNAFADFLVQLIPLCADFVAAPDCAGRVSTFVDLSRVLAPRNITAATWDWGDGQTTFLSPPVSPVTHTFAQPGVYNVTLNVTSSAGEHDDHTSPVTIDACPIANFSCVGLVDPYLRVDFTDLSTDLDNDIVAWSWDFGGAGSTRQHPSHDFAARGLWPVTLTVTDARGHQDSVTKDCLALLNLPPVASIAPEYHVRSGSVVVALIVGTDPENDTLRHFGAGFPSWITVSSTDGTIAGRAPWVEVPRPYPGEVWVQETATRDLYLSARVPTTIWVHPIPPPTLEPEDRDRDGLTDALDNCVDTFNDEQTDVDGDGTGDACIEQTHGGSTQRPPAAGDAADGSGMGMGGGAPGGGAPGGGASCPAVGGRDADRDGHVDACDADVDGDGIPQTDRLGRRIDNCPTVANAGQADGNGDGVGDACDAGNGGPANERDARAGSGGAGPRSQPDDAALSDGFPTALVVGGAVAGAGAVGILGLVAWRRRRS